MTGRFITFEGGEGAGKSTQIDRLRTRLEKLSQPVLITREPGGSPKAERIREFLLHGGAKALGPMAEAMLFYAARLDHLDETIKPALAAGTHVLCDRFADSTRAYQGAVGKVDATIISALERVVLDGTEPDLTFILDVPTEVGLARARRRREAKGEGADRFEAEDASFHDALRRAYLDIAASTPQRCVVIEAGADADKVEDAIWTALRDRIPSLTRPAEVAADVA
jgi:dTMP kinase